MAGGRQGRSGGPVARKVLNISRLAALGFFVFLFFYPFKDRSALVYFGLAVAIALLVVFLTNPSKRPEKVLSIEELIRLAQAELVQGRSFQAEKHYCQAIYRLIMAGKTDQAAKFFEEYFMRFRKVFAPRLQLEICRSLCQSGKYLLATRSLEKLIADWPLVYRHSDPRFLEQAYLHLARIYAEKLDLPALAVNCYFDFLDRFPHSIYRDTALYQVQVLEPQARAAV